MFLSVQNHHLQSHILYHPEKQVDLSCDIKIGGSGQSMGKMQRLAAQGNISFSCIDFNRRVYLTDFSTRLQMRAPLDFAYLSNIYMDSYANYEYVGTQLESVVGPETYFIDTERFYHNGLHNNQRLQQRGQAPLFSIMKKSEKEMELFGKDKEGIASFIP